MRFNAFRKYKKKKRLHYVKRVFMDVYELQKGIENRGDNLII